MVKFDEKRCTACGACAVACMDQRNVDVSARRPYRVVYEEEWADGLPRCVSSACRHCARPLCAEACPEGVFRRDGELGLVLYDNSRCTGCGACAAACPFDALSFDFEGRVDKCDGCAQRLRAGLAPACAAVCPTGALHE